MLWVRWLDGITDSRDMSLKQAPGVGWWTGKAGVLQSMGLQRVGHNWATELNWTEWNVMHLNHPETIPLPWSMENLSSAQLVPGAKKVGDCWHRVKESPCPGSVGLRVSPVHGGQSLGASGNVNTPMLTCFQEPECFPSPEPLQCKVFSASWEKTKWSSRVDTASSLQNTFLARLSCLLILNLWWFARSTASILQHEIFPRAQRFSSCPPPVFCAERMETLALVRYLAHLYDFSFRELQTLRK